MVSKQNISLIEGKIGYRFRDPSLLLQAFTRTSFCNEKNYGGRNDYSSNEVLEFFGDSALSTAIVTILLRKNTTRYAHGIKTDLKEGDFSNIRSKLSDKRNLSKSMAKLGLQKYLLLGEGDEKLGINEEPSVMEDLFESIIGAVYIDSEMNIERVISVVEKMLDLDAYESAEAPIQSYKNALQEWCADKKHRLPSPVYKTVSESGPDHKKVYERGVYLGERLVATGVGKNQKLADNAAAEAALSALKSEKKEQAHTELAKSAEGAARALRELADSKKLPSPEYHDLGESPESTQTRKIYIVECCFSGKSATAKGYSKQEARDLASADLLKMIESEGKQKSNNQKKITSASTTARKVTAIAKWGKSAAPSKSELAIKENNPPKKISNAANTKKALLQNANAKAAKKAALAKSTPKKQKSASPKRKPLHHTKRS